MVNPPQACQVEHPQNIAGGRVADRSGRARPFLHLLAKMLGGKHLHRASCHKGSPDGVRPCPILCPGRAEDEIHVFCFQHQRQVAIEMDDIACRVAKRNQVAGVHRSILQLQQKRLEYALKRVTLPKGLNLFPGQGDRCSVAQRMDALLLTALPRFVHQRSNGRSFTDS